MWNPSLITDQLQLLKLGNSGLKGAIDSAKPGLQGFLGGSGDLLKKVTSIGVVLPRANSLGFSNQLGDDMQVADLSEGCGDLSKVLVRADLFNEGLRKSAGVVLISFVWSTFDCLRACRQRIWEIPP